MTAKHLFTLPDGTAVALPKPPGALFKRVKAAQDEIMKAEIERIRAEAKAAEVDDGATATPTPNRSR